MPKLDTASTRRALVGEQVTLLEALAANADHLAEEGQELLAAADEQEELAADVRSAGADDETADQLEQDARALAAAGNSLLETRAETALRSDDERPDNFDRFAHRL